MIEPLRDLLRRLSEDLSLPYTEGSEERRACRAGALFRVQLGSKTFALKI